MSEATFEVINEGKRVYVDGINKIESLGATVRLELFVFENNGKTDADGKPVLDRKIVETIIMPVQVFPEVSALCNQSIEQFVNDGIYKRANKEAAK